jgi:hypothetical protein
MHWSTVLYQHSWYSTANPKRGTCRYCMWPLPDSPDISLLYRSATWLYRTLSSSHNLSSFLPSSPDLYLTCIASAVCTWPLPGSLDLQLTLFTFTSFFKSQSFPLISIWLFRPLSCPLETYRTCTVLFVALYLYPRSRDLFIAIVTYMAILTSTFIC